MYVDRNEIRRLVAGASDGGWDCVGVCYGVPDLGERVLEDMPQAGDAADAAAEKVHQLLARRHDSALGCLTGIGAILRPDRSFVVEVRIDPRCQDRPEVLFPEVPASVDGFPVVFVRRPGAVAFGGLGYDPDGDCARIPPTWFRPENFEQEPPPSVYRCPPGYEAIGLRCAGPCGGYWCKPVGAPGGFGQTSEIPGVRAQEGAFPVGVAVVVFGVILGGFVLSFFVKRSPAGRWRLER